MRRTHAWEEAGMTGRMVPRLPELQAPEMEASGRVSVYLLTIVLQECRPWVLLCMNNEELKFRGTPTARLTIILATHARLLS